MSFIAIPGSASQYLVLSGTVPVRGDIEVQFDARGKMILIARDNKSITVTTQKRGLASVVVATAP